MFFSDIPGYESQKKLLTLSSDRGRIPHAQLFYGHKAGVMLAMALACSRYIISGNTGGENLSGKECLINLKCERISHPDIHFLYPTSTHEKKTKGIDFFEQWQEFCIKTPFANFMEWIKFINVEKKQAKIGVQDAHELIRSMSFKPVESKRKIAIIWMVDKLNIEASNKLLKLLEEPPKNTYFILITENIERLLPTITSRCQFFYFQPLSHEELTQFMLKNYNNDIEASQSIASRAQGDIDLAIKYAQGDAEQKRYEVWFVYWLRCAFKIKNNKNNIIPLINWSEKMSQQGRDTQKDFLIFAMELFRQSLLKNYGLDALVYYKPFDETFNFDTFSKLITHLNILDIFNEIEKAIEHVQRNGNSKMIFTDLSMSLTSFIHKKAKH